MVRLIKILLLTLIATAAAQSASAQRRVTPVKPSEPLRITDTSTDAKAKKNTRPASVVRQTDDSGREFLLDTITGSEYVDSMALAQPKAIGNMYPLWQAVTVGIDIWNPLMRAFQQKYGLAGAWAEVSLHNRYFPVVEFGLGNAHGTPDDGNFTYRSPIAPFFKIGCNYNFLYNSNPDYQLYAGVRYGITRFAYAIDDVTVRNEYWGETSTFNIPRQHTTIGYGEVMAGLKVKVAGQWQVGWSVKFHKIFHSSRAPYGRPWYVPGYGTRRSPLGVSLSVMYTIPLHRHKPETAITNDTNEANEAPLTEYEETTEQ